MIQITISNKLGPLWGDLSVLTDEEVIDLVREDIIEFCNGATWTVKRAEESIL